MVPLGLPMAALVPTFLPMVTLAPMVPLAAEKRSGFSGYQWYHWLPMVPLVKFPMVPLGESRTHAYFSPNKNSNLAGQIPNLARPNRNLDVMVIDLDLLLLN